MDGTDTDGQLDTVATFANPRVPFSRAGVAERHTWPSPGKESNFAHQILELRTFQWCHFEHTPSPRSWNGNLLNWISMYMQQHAYACLVRSSVKTCVWLKSINRLPATSLDLISCPWQWLDWLDMAWWVGPIMPHWSNLWKRPEKVFFWICLRMSQMVALVSNISKSWNRRPCCISLFCQAH